MNIVAEPKPICRYCGKTSDMYGTLLTKKLKADLSSQTVDKSGFWRCKFCLTANSREDYVVEKNFLKLGSNLKIPKYYDKSKEIPILSINSRKFDSINPSKSQHMTQSSAQTKRNYLLTHKSSLPNTFAQKYDNPLKKISGSTKNSCNSSKPPLNPNHFRKLSSNYKTPNPPKNHDFLDNERKVYSHSKVLDQLHEKYESNSSLGHSLSVSNLGSINIVDSCPNIVTFNNNINKLETNNTDLLSYDNIIDKTGSDNSSILESDTDKINNNGNKIVKIEDKISDPKLPSKQPKTRLIDQFSFNSIEETKESLKRLLALTSTDNDEPH